MKTTLPITLAFASCIVIGCATTRPPAELVEARAAYADAELTANRAAPKDLHAAKVALDSAERSFADDPGDVEVRDRAYIATRLSELARSRAAIYTLNEEKMASNKQLQVLGARAATELRTTKVDLTDAKEKMRVAASDVTTLRENLEQSESRASSLESRASDLESGLAVERKARVDAEERVRTTLLAMRDLQSVKEEERGLVITLSGAVLFSSSKAVLLPAARAALDNVADALVLTPERHITILGHTDAQGSAQSNMDLSQRRADAVRLYLISRGVDAAHVEANGMGQEQPIAENTTAEGRANNRRVEIVLAKETDAH
jgi:outer membrane protein OmpA-like peptidoglycan-associated protein